MYSGNCYNISTKYLSLGVIMYKYKFVNLDDNKIYTVKNKNLRRLFKDVSKIQSEITQRKCIKLIKIEVR
jgi:hypothetical protein